MKLHSSRTAWPWFLILTATVSMQAALAIGGFVYTKHYETHLLAEPNPLAANSSTIVQIGSKLDVQEVKGHWLRVHSANGSGWIFAGNVAETKPDAVVNSNGPVEVASKTTATAAARGLSEVADGYAARRNLGSARDDLNWLEKQGGTVSREEVDKFLREQKKGEFQ